MAGWNLLGNSKTATTITGESITSTGVADSTIKLSGNHDNALVANTFRVYNSTYGTFLASGNYKIAEATGIITLTNPSKLSAGTYSVDYQSGAINSTVSTLVKVVFGVVAAIASILVIFRYGKK